MPILLLCPNGHRLSVAEENAGKEIKCDVCEAVVRVPWPTAEIVPSSPSVRPADFATPMEITAVDEPVRTAITEFVAPLDKVEVIEDAPPSPTPAYSIGGPEPPGAASKRRAQKAGRKWDVAHQMSLVKLGLGFHYSRILAHLVGIHLAAIVLFAVGQATQMSASHGFDISQPAPRLGLLIVALFVIFVLLLAGLGLVGSIVCFRAPAETNARGYIVFALALDGLHLVLGATGFLFDRAEDVAAWLLVSELMSTLSWISFMLFLRMMCIFLHEDGLREHAVKLLLKGGAAMGGALLLGFLVAPFLNHQLTMFLFIAGIGAVICWGVFVSLLWPLAELIGSIRQVIHARY